MQKNSKVNNNLSQFIHFKIFFYDQDFDSELNLRFVRIYFYATTFDRVTKDRAATFVDKLSAIGGTMGLLTGFSISPVGSTPQKCYRLGQLICVL